MRSGDRGVEAATDRPRSAGEPGGSDTAQTALELTERSRRLPARGRGFGHRVRWWIEPHCDAYIGKLLHSTGHGVVLPCLVELIYDAVHRTM